MPAAPIHHTAIDKTGSWNGPAAETAFDKVAGDFPKLYAWIDEGETDADADGTDKEDGWGPHHDVDAKGIPGDANEKGFQATMGALNGAHGGNSVIPSGDRQAVWNHLAAHYRDSGVDQKDIPELQTVEANSRRERWYAFCRANPPKTAEQRVDDSTSFGDIQSLVYAALIVELGKDAEDGVGDIDIWVRDLSDEWVVFHRYGGDEPGDWQLNYSIDASDVVTFTGDPIQVVEQTEYVPAPEANAAAKKGMWRAVATDNADYQAGKGDKSAGVPQMSAADFAASHPNADPDDYPFYQAGYAADDTDGGLELVDANAQAAAATPGGGDAADGEPVCSYCGASNDSDADYCDQCGQFLGNGAPVVTVDDPTDEANTPDPGIEDPQRHKTPMENLLRARHSSPGAPSVLLRDATSTPAGQSGSLMFGYFSTFNEWYEIDSWFEGQFLERVAPGAYSETIQGDKSSMRVLYDHGFDPQLGNKPLGPLSTLREDAIGGYYEVPLLDTDYNRNFVLPALRGLLMSGETVGSQLGASFRFIVRMDQWDRSGKVTIDNPKGLPLRTITNAQVLELGPVTFPANEGASSGVRSTTDAFIDRLRHDPVALARFTDRTSPKVVQRMFASVPAAPFADTSKTPKPPAASGPAVRSKAARKAKSLDALHHIES
jgi:hypothetical protein